MEGQIGGVETLFFRLSAPLQQKTVVLQWFCKGSYITKKFIFTNPQEKKMQRLLERTHPNKHLPWTGHPDLYHKRHYFWWVYKEDGKRFEETDTLAVMIIPKIYNR